MYEFNKCFKNQNANWDNHSESISLYAEYLMQREGENHRPKLAQVIAPINQSHSSISSTTSTPSIIFDPVLKAREACSADSAKNISGRQFGIP